MCSELYNMATKEGWQLPKEWTGYSQHSYNIQPLPSKKLLAKDIVAFRDNAFHTYNESKKYLDILHTTFGPEVKKHMQNITLTRLKRKILEE